MRKEVPVLVRSPNHGCQEGGRRVEKSTQGGMGGERGDCQENDLVVMGI